MNTAVKQAISSKNKRIINPNKSSQNKLNNIMHEEMPSSQNRSLLNISNQINSSQAKMNSKSNYDITLSHNSSYNTSLHNMNKRQKTDSIGEIQFDFPEDYEEQNGISPLHSGKYNQSKQNLHQSELVIGRVTSDANSKQHQQSTCVENNSILSKKDQITSKILNEGVIKIQLQEKDEGSQDTHNKLGKSQDMTNSPVRNATPNNRQSKQINYIETLFHGVKISQLVGKFINIMKGGVNLKNLSEDQLILIGDQSYIQKHELKASFCMHYLRACIDAYRKMSVFYPENKLIMVWEVAYDFTLLVILILLMAHIAGCGFHQVGVFETFNNRHSWLQQFDIENKSFYDKYISSIYFAFISMITVGYGDIHPVSTNEKVYAVLMTIVSCGVFGYCVNKLGEIFRERAFQKRKLEKQQNIISEYLKQRNINIQTQYKILKNIEYQNQQNFGVDKEGAEIISAIDSDLQQEFFRSYFGKLLHDVKVFQLNFSQQTLDQTSLIMQEIIIKQGDKLFQENEQVDQLFMLIKGKIQLYKEQKNNTIQLGNVEPGRFISMNKFFAFQTHDTSAICQENSRIVVLKRENFVEIVKKQSRDFERFIDLRDSIQLKQKYLIQGEVCQSCKNKNHDLKDCPELHAKVDPFFIIRKHQYSPEQQRQRKTRRTNKRDRPREGYVQELQQQQQLQEQIVSKSDQILSPVSFSRLESATPYNRFNTLNELAYVREDLKEIRVKMVYLLKGFVLDEEQEEYYEKNIPIYDSKFFNVIPKISNNKINQTKLEQIQETIEKIEGLIVNNVGETDPMFIDLNLQLEDLHDLDTSFSDDSEFELDESFEDKKLKCQQNSVERISLNKISQISEEEDSETETQANNHQKKERQSIRKNTYGNPNQKKMLQKKTKSKNLEEQQQQQFQEEFNQNQIQEQKHGALQQMAQNLIKKPKQMIDAQGGFQPESIQGQITEAFRQGTGGKRMSCRYKTPSKEKHMSIVSGHNINTGGRRVSTVDFYKQMNSFQGGFKKRNFNLPSQNEPLQNQNDPNIQLFAPEQQGFRDTSGLGFMEKFFDCIREFQCYKVQNNISSIISRHQETDKRKRKIMRKQVVDEISVFKNIKQKNSQFGISSKLIKPKMSQINSTNNLNGGNSPTKKSFINQKNLI